MGTRSSPRFGRALVAPVLDKARARARAAAHSATPRADRLAGAALLAAIERARGAQPDATAPTTLAKRHSRVRRREAPAPSKDFLDVMQARLPIVFAFVLSLAFGLLLMTFRSIVAPIVAIALNLLSVGAAYGVLVLVFQDGLGEELLDFRSVGGITSWLPPATS